MNAGNFEIGRPLQPAGSRPLSPAAKDRLQQDKVGSESFQQALIKASDSNGLKFSKHAMERIEARKLSLSDQRLSSISEAVAKADAKGSRESLIIMKDMALVVSVRNRTVITAMDPEGMKGNIFTNIDSAVVMD